MPFTRPHWCCDRNSSHLEDIDVDFVHMPSGNQQRCGCQGSRVLRQSRRSYCPGELDQIGMQLAHKLKVVPRRAIDPLRCLHWYLLVLAEHF